MTATDTDALKRLLTVQEHDRSLDALNHALANLPGFGELERLSGEISSLSVLIEEVSDRRHVLERDQKRLEDEVALVEDRVAAEDAKLYGGGVGVKELQALQDEIKGLRKRQGLVEDQIIEIMEAAEPVDAEFETLHERSGALDSEVESVNQAIAESQAQLGGEITELEAQRAEAAGGVRADVLEDYESIRAQPGRIGVAKLVGATCHGCHLELPAVEVDRLKKLPADALVHCEECGCILVR